MAVLTTDTKTVQLTDEHYSKVIERCRPMMGVYTLDTAVKPAERLEAIEDFGVYKSDRLSAHTIPAELLTLIRRRGTNSRLSGCPKLKCGV